MTQTQSVLHNLTTEQRTSFKVNGFITVEDVLTDDEVDALAGRADLIASGEAEHIPERCIQQEQVFRRGEREVTDQVLSVRKLHMLAVHDEVMWQHATNPKIVDIIADLLGTDDIKLYNDQLFMKAPETGTAQGWHQDSGSWRDIFPMDWSPPGLLSTTPLWRTVASISQWAPTNGACSRIRLEVRWSTS